MTQINDNRIFFTCRVDSRKGLFSVLSFGSRERCTTKTYDHCF